MPAANSYILLANVSAEYLKDLREALTQLNLPWLSPSHLPNHLTLGQAFGTRADEPQLIEARNERLAKAIRKLIKKNKQNSTLLIPSDINISEHGWVILNYVDAGISNATDLNAIHTDFEKYIHEIKTNFQLSSDRHGDNFLPHVSLGKVKSKSFLLSQSEIDSARDALEMHKTHIINTLHQVCTLVIDDLDFIYNDVNGTKIILYSRFIPKRPFGITELNTLENDVVIQMEDMNHARQLEKFIFSISGLQFRPKQSVNSVEMTIPNKDFVKIQDLIDDPAQEKRVKPRPEPKVSQLASTTASSASSSGSVTPFFASKPKETEIEAMINKSVMTYDWDSERQDLIIKFKTYRDAERYCKYYFHRPRNITADSEFPYEYSIRVDDEELRFAMDKQFFRF